jgi:hypothetical protein
MLTEIDSILFPDDCEVVEMPLHNQWVYLIQKNGSTRIRKIQKSQNLKLFVNEQIQDLDFVDVYIRHPTNRYVSGVNTYLHHLRIDHPQLDLSTAFWFAKEYKFLNRHYLPQFHWILNLSRYLEPHTKIRIRDFDDFDIISTDIHRAGVVPSDDDFKKKLLDNNKGMEFWLFLDRILLNLAGQEMTWTEILNYYKNTHKSTFDVIYQRYALISKNVLP